LATLDFTSEYIGEFYSSFIERSCFDNVADIRRLKARYMTFSNIAHKVSICRLGLAGDDFSQYPLIFLLEASSWESLDYLINVLFVQVIAANANVDTGPCRDKCDLRPFTIHNPR